MVNILDKNLHHYARKIVAAGGPDVEQTAGAGAAGGLGAGLIAFTGATMKRGVELVIEATQLQKRQLALIMFLLVKEELISRLNLVKRHMESLRQLKRWLLMLQ